MHNDEVFNFCRDLDLGVHFFLLALLVDFAHCIFLASRSRRQHRQVDLLLTCREDKASSLYCITTEFSQGFWNLPDLH